MGSYILRRLGASIVTLAGISVVIFAMLHVVYPLPGRDVLGNQAGAAQVACLADSYPAGELPSRTGVTVRLGRTCQASGPASPAPRQSGGQASPNRSGPLRPEPRMSPVSC